MRWPDAWPSNGALVARALIYAERERQLGRFALTAMRMQFLEGLDLGELYTLGAIATRMGFSPNDTAAAVEDPEIDAAMRAASDEAIARGVFGIPTVLVGDTLFWGDDRLDEAAALAAHAPQQ
jgi:2-hydroxychromene-2-carboxylate isomerase